MLLTESTVTPEGLFKVQLVAATFSEPAPLAPVPANVVITPVTMSTTLTLLLPESAMYKVLFSESNDIPCGPFNCADVA